jgi:hypothetical protein|tara:strand:- start:114 stop:812 length:699 start_codon:yes stop_codon:yes gene_type:complete
MSNPAFPDLLKIGKSKKDPTQDRVSELNQTGVPEPFRVEYYAFVENEDALETLAHKHFSAKRPNKKREFFSVDCAVAINTIRDLAMRHSSIKFEEVFYVSPDELQAQRLDQEAKELAKAEAIKTERIRRWDMEAKARQEREEAEKIEADRQEAEKAKEKRIGRQNTWLMGIVFALVWAIFSYYIASTATIPFERNLFGAIFLGLGPALIPGGICAVLFTWVADTIRKKINRH